MIFIYLFIKYDNWYNFRILWKIVDILTNLLIKKCRMTVFIEFMINFRLFLLTFFPPSLLKESFLLYIYFLCNLLATIVRLILKCQLQDCYNRRWKSCSEKCIKNLCKYSKFIRKILNLPYCVKNWNMIFELLFWNKRIGYFILIFYLIKNKVFLWIRLISFHLSAFDS